VKLTKYTVNLRIYRNTGTVGVLFDPYLLFDSHIGEKIRKDVMYY